MGVHTTLYKVLALVLSAVFTAIAGGIHAYWITFIDPASAFDLTLNVQMVIMAVFGGPGTVFGPVIGAFILSVIYEYLSSSISTAAALLFGIVIVLAVVFMPRGLMDLGRGIRRDGLGYFLRNVGRMAYDLGCRHTLTRRSRCNANFPGFVSVANVSFSLARSEIVGLVGPNGAGKTTFDQFDQRLSCTRRG